MQIRTLARAGGLALILATASCTETPEGWTPVLEQTSTTFVGEETDAALEEIARARATLTEEPGEARDALERAELTLRRLSGVYLPVYEAKTRAYNAYRYHLLGRDDEAGSELAGIESTLLDLGGRADPPLLGELERIDELTARARLEVEAGSEEASEALRRLAEGLETFLLKRDLWR